MRHALLTLTVGLAMVGDQYLPSPPPITVSAAVSLSDALTAVAQEYGTREHGDVRFNFAGSNVLARQITSGAPVDVFISADEDQMDVVATAGMVTPNTRVDVLANQLAVVVPNDRPRTFTSIRNLTEPAYKRIALGDPAAVPAGVYAKRYLQKEGFWTTIEPRVVASVSVRAALAAVDTGAADAAIVYRTDARLSSRASLAWVVPAAVGPRIRYPAAVLQTSTHPDQARRFVDFLVGAAASPIFKRFGFTPLH